MKRISLYFGSGQRSSATIFSSWSLQLAHVLHRRHLVVARVGRELQALDPVGVGVRLLERGDRLGELAHQRARLGGLPPRPAASTRQMMAMERVRELGDQLEKIVADDLWPLPKCREILFIESAARGPAAAGPRRASSRRRPGGTPCRRRPPRWCWCRRTPPRRCRSGRRRRPRPPPGRRAPERPIVATAVHWAMFRPKSTSYCPAPTAPTLVTATPPL